jgi:hypothetical protein
MRLRQDSSHTMSMWMAYKASAHHLIKLVPLPQPLERVVNSRLFGFIPSLTQASYSH